jgi:tRNA(His) 5'-end guanylyltransferase
MIDELGDRMKENYENRTRFYLPRRTYTIVRVDGKAFHTYTRGCEKPYDIELMMAMDVTAAYMCKQMQGAEFAYVQSDEISVLLTDFTKDGTAAWYDGNLQKLASVSASLATAGFNMFMQNLAANPKPTMALFDCRVFTIPDPTEVYNYFVWRQKDAARNSIQMAAQAEFSPKELHGKDCGELISMLFTERDINWMDYPAGCRLGRLIAPQYGAKTVEFTHKKTGEKQTIEVTEHQWRATEDLPVFVDNPDWLRSRIPLYS